MTEMKNARWERMVAKVQIVSARDGMGPVVLRSTAVTLLARQQAGFVRLVKRLRKQGPEIEFGSENYGYNRACNDILAALATQKENR